MSILGRRAALTSIALVLAPVLAACGAGPNAIIVQPYAPGDGVMAESEDGDISVLNALVVGPAEPGGAGVVSLTISNDDEDEPDELVGMSAGEAGQIVFSGEQEVRPGGTLVLGPTASETAKAQAAIADLQAANGDSVTLTLNFRNAGTVSFSTVVVAPDSYYEGYTVDLTDPTNGEPGGVEDPGLTEDTDITDNPPGTTGDGTTDGGTTDGGATPGATDGNG